MSEDKRIARLLDRLMALAEMQKNTKADNDFMEGYSYGKREAYNFCIEIICEELGLKEGDE